MKITAKEYKRRIDLHIDYVKTNCMSDTARDAYNDFISTIMK